MMVLPSAPSAFFSAQSARRSPAFQALACFVEHVEPLLP